MSVIVSFVTAKGVGSIANPAINACRVRETLALDSSTTATCAADEMVLILNNETSAVFVAFGSNANAALAAESSQSSAGVPVPAGGLLALNPPKGSKINVKTTS